jgi:hypothetical protein
VMEDDFYWLNDAWELWEYLCRTIYALVLYCCSIVECAHWALQLSCLVDYLLNYLCNGFICGSVLIYSLIFIL